MNTERESTQQVPRADTASATARAAANLRDASESLARARHALDAALDRYYALHAEWRRAGR